MYSKRFAGLTPYVPGEQPKDRQYIKLNTNESPYPPSPKVDEWLKQLDSESLKLYPDPLSGDLCQAIADCYGLSTDQVFVGNGSDEVLAHAFYALFEPSAGPLQYPEHTYSFYPVYCDFYELKRRTIPMANDWGIPLNEFLSVEGTCGTIFPNPNAPTGMALPLKEIKTFLNKVPKDYPVIVDEAYVDFGAESAISLIKDFPNLLVVHTLSKSRSLAGMRVGYALGQPEIIRSLWVVKDSFNSYPLDRVAQGTAAAAIRDKDYYNQINGRIIQTRDNFSTALKSRGWNVLPSSSNFVFASCPEVDGKTVLTRLKEEGFLVRHFSNPALKDFVRITIGTEEQMNALLTKIGELWG